MYFTILIGILVIVGVSVIMAWGELWQLARVTLFGSRNKSSFDPARDISSLAGKVLLITGAAGDLGRQTATELARYGRPARIYVADLPRDDSAKKELIGQINREAYGEAQPELDETTGKTTPRTDIRYLDLDLTSFQSIQKCAAEFIAKEDQLDILVLNAGIIRVATGKTMEGYEIHFGLNYLGHALLSRLLLPTMQHTAEQRTSGDVRVVIVSSEGYAMAPKRGIQFDRVKSECSEMVSTQQFYPLKSHVAYISTRDERMLTIKLPSLTLSATVRAS
jgi:retinol dehydrogenase-12